uniref:Uncharacterized protein n=1 Tax=Ixodes ricinus TaxID=34613 RepID=A0A6B0UT29_IXORI
MGFLALGCWGGDGIAATDASSAPTLGAGPGGGATVEDGAGGAFTLFSSSWRVDGRLQEVEPAAGAEPAVGAEPPLKKDSPVSMGRELSRNGMPDASLVLEVWEGPDAAGPALFMTIVMACSRCSSMSLFCSSTCEEASH